MKRKIKRKQRTKAFGVARIEVRQQISPVEGTWHEVVALGWDADTAMLASFCNKAAAAECRRVLLAAIRQQVKEAK